MKTEEEIKKEIEACAKALEMTQKKTKRIDYGRQFEPGISQS